MQIVRVFWRVALSAVLTACVAVPPPSTEVMTLRAGALPQEPGVPPAGTTWRLEENDLHALSPAPYVPPPPLLLPYPVAGVAPPPAYAPYAYVPAPVFYFGLGYTAGGHRHGFRPHSHRFRVPRAGRP